MIYASSFAAADERARVITNVDGREYVLREYVGAAPSRGMYVEGNEVNDNDQPQGFLVDQPGDATTGAHFHEHNQFQVFVEGHGRMGKEDARPLSVHYAGAHTPYGPIVAGPEGLRYFTLRQRWDPGAKYMPAMRDRLVRGQQRHRLVADVDALMRSAKPSGVASVTQALAMEDDGLAVHCYRAPRGTSITALDPATGSGQYWLVLQGALRIGDSTVGELGCGYLDPDEAALNVSSTDTVVCALMMQFPQPRTSS